MHYRFVMADEDYLEHHGILGQRWGLRRYQNADGTLTELGKSRLRQQRDAEINKNADKYDPTKSDYQAKVDALERRIYDPNDVGRSTNTVEKWVTDDTRNLKKVVDTTSNVAKQFSKIEQDSAPKPVKKRMKLDDMTDQELRERINREMLEKQYNELFGKTEQPKISKGRQFARNALEVTGATLGLASTALGIALAMRELRGHGSS